MDDQRLERIMAHPDRATMDDVRWLCEMLVQLQVDYADEKVRCFKVEQNLDECRKKLARVSQRVAALVDKLTQTLQGRLLITGQAYDEYISLDTVLTDSDGLCRPGAP